MDHEVKVYDSRMPAGLFALLFLAMTALPACAGIRGWQYALFSLIIPLLLYWRLRLDAEEGTLFICGVIPVSRIVWQEGNFRSSVAAGCSSFLLPAVTSCACSCETGHG